MAALVFLIVGLAIVLFLTIRRERPLHDRNVLEVAAGFLGWCVINTLLWVWVLHDEPGTLFMNPVRLIPLCVNVPALLLVSARRRWITLGILVAILVNAVGTLLFTAPGPIEDDRVFDVIGMAPFFLSFFYPAP